MKGYTKDVSVIIVNHNTKVLCEQAINSVFDATHYTDCEIIVVDNSSNPEEFFFAETDKIICISNAKNLGFGNACNIGAKKATGKYLLFLNSDTILNDGVLDKAVAYIKKNNNIGVLGVKTILNDGSIDLSSKRGFPTPANALFYFMKLDKLFPNNKYFGGYHLTYLNPEETNKVDSVSGSFLMIPKEIFQLIGGFDETFFMYGEDMDLCYRVKEIGKDIVYLGGASIRHLKGQSGLHTSNPQVIKYFYDSMLIFYDKHYKQKYSKITGMLVHAAIKLKYLKANLVLK